MFAFLSYITLMSLCVIQKINAGNQEYAQYLSFFDWFSLSELTRHVHFGGAMVLSTIAVLQLWYAYNNNDDL